MCAVADWNRLYDERGWVMDNLRSYIVSLICSALICGIVKILAGSIKASIFIIYIVCGLFLMITVLSPALDFEIPDLNSAFQPVYSEAVKISEDARDASREDMAVIIKEETKTYILEKANLNNMDIDVEVKLDEQGLVPCGVTITGQVSPYDKTVLTNYIHRMLNIPEEAQEWVE